MKSTAPLIEHLRRVDALAFLRWETYGEDLMARAITSQPMAGCHDKRSDSGSDNGAGVGGLQHELIPNTLRPWVPPFPPEISNEEIILALAKREARSRAQHSVYLMLLYYPGDYASFDRSQTEGLLRAAGLDPAREVNRVVLNALDLYRKAGAPAVAYNRLPEGLWDQPLLACVPGLSREERLQLLAIEASLSAIDRCRRSELEQVDIDPDDPLLDRLQALEEQTVGLFVATVLEGGPEGLLGSSSLASDAKEPDELSSPAAAKTCRPDHEVILSLATDELPQHSDSPGQFKNAFGSAPQLPKKLGYILLALVARELSATVDLRPPLDAESIEGPRRLLGFLYKWLILETENFLGVTDYELRQGIVVLSGDPEDLLPCKLRLLLTELRDCQHTCCPLLSAGPINKRQEAKD